MLEEVREKYQLTDRVTMLGAVDHTDVRGVSCGGVIGCGVVDHTGVRGVSCG